MASLADLTTLLQELWEAAGPRYVLIDWFDVWKILAHHEYAFTDDAIAELLPDEVSRSTVSRRRIEALERVRGAEPALRERVGAAAAAELVQRGVALLDRSEKRHFGEASAPPRPIEPVLDTLSDADGWVRSEDIAVRCGVSQYRVYVAIRDLVADGHPVRAKRGYGYCLDACAQ